MWYFVAWAIVTAALVWAVMGRRIIDEGIELPKLRGGDSGAVGNAFEDWLGMAFSGLVLLGALWAVVWGWQAGYAVGGFVGGVVGAFVVFSVIMSL